MQEFKVLIGMTGSIGILNMPMYLPYFRNVFSEVKIIMTEAAKQFISEEALSLMGAPVYSHLFPVSSTENCHVHLARWADLFFILPATANILAETACGMSRSLLSATILCHQHPILFFPNMNSAMWNHPATQKNVSILEEYGHKIIPPKEQMGFEYASGQVKEGTFMLPLEEIMEILQEEIQKRCDASILE